MKQKGIEKQKGKFKTNIETSSMVNRCQTKKKIITWKIFRGSNTPGGLIFMYLQKPTL